GRLDDADSRWRLRGNSGRFGFRQVEFDPNAGGAGSSHIRRGSPGRCTLHGPTTPHRSTGLVFATATGHARSTDAGYFASVLGTASRTGGFPKPLRSGRAGPPSGWTGRSRRCADRAVVGRPKEAGGAGCGTARQSGFASAG